MTLGSGEIDWSDDFIVVDTAVAAGKAIKQLGKANVHWVVLRHQDGLYLYAFELGELWRWNSLEQAKQRKDLAKVTFESLLGLNDEIQSTKTTNRLVPPQIDRSWRPNANAPSVLRYVQIDPTGQPLAVGSELLGKRLKDPPTVVPAPAVGERRRGHRSLPPAGSTTTRGLPPASGAEPEAPSTSGGMTIATSLEDEGTSPQRFPSIEASASLVAGEPVHLTIDLLRDAIAHTQGAVSLGNLAADWQTVKLDVLLACQQIEFDGEARGTITIRRNDTSIPIVISGRLRSDVAANAPVVVMASFFDGTRFCGSAMRAFVAAGTTRDSPPPTSAVGTVVVEPTAARPDVTVYITRSGDEKSPGLLRWQVVCDRFDGLPASLTAEVDLKCDPAEQAGKLFKEFAVLAPGQHRTRIEGFGSRLWQLAPAMFHAVYWALVRRFSRALTIQFISDEPHMPWELMRPVNADESDIHPPLALKHSVARWISRYDGYMRNQLPAGGICTFAPKYASASRRLQRAEAESKMLVDDFGAVSLPAKRQNVLDLLENGQPNSSVSILHFAGHGQFAPDVATESNIKLEDGALAASEVERPEVRLGKACRTVVFFNACEVGAAGAVFGEVGGWADAFLGRQFGGFIAPLWSVDDDDAGTVAAEFMAGVFKQHQPIGEVLRAVRAKHGEKSPTFYSYLYYGDVTARISSG